MRILTNGTFSREVRRSNTDEYLLVNLLRMWRRRVSALAREGMDRLDGVRFQYVRNCPPFPHADRLDRPMRRCFYAQICPWCYARMVPKLFRRIARAKRRGARRLLVIHRRFLLDPREEADKRTFYVRVGREVRTMTTKWRRATGVLGGTVLWTVAPDDDAGMRADVRILLALPPDLVPAERRQRQDPLAVWTTFPAVTPAYAAKAIARFARYPGKLLSADLEDTFQVLHNRYPDRARMMDSFGVMRGRGRRRR